jgi:hypothetical protein
MIVAKPVVKDQYWILKENNQKVGEIASANGELVVKFKDPTRFKTFKMNGRVAPGIEFEPPVERSDSEKNFVHGYEVKGLVFNPVWDVKQRLPLFTREDKSKSWYAAGWYLVKQHRNWKAVQHPKLITLQRYPYQGPFFTKEEANEHKD